jgi:hypothetical protein
MRRLRFVGRLFSKLRAEYDADASARRQRAMERLAADPTVARRPPPKSCAASGSRFWHQADRGYSSALGRSSAVLSTATLIGLCAAGEGIDRP